MLLFVIGLPGRFAEWCVAATAEIARRALGPTEVICANTLEEVAVGMIRTGAARAVVVSRQPSGRLRSALHNAGRTFVAAVDDPRGVLAETAREQQRGIADAARAVASSCAAIIGFMSSPGALTLYPDRDGGNPVTTATAIARHFGLAVSDSAIVEIIGSLAAAGLTLEGREAAAVDWRDGLAADELSMVEGSLTPYATHLATGDLPPINWQGELFFLGDHPSEPPTGTIDVTGRARCLFDGPNIALPAGNWSLSLKLMFSREATERDFLVEVVADRQLASCTIRPRTEGGFEAHLAFVIDATTDHPIAIRFSNQRAAFDGAVGLVGATLTAELAATGGADSGFAAVANGC